MALEFLITLDPGLGFVEGKLIGVELVLVLKLDCFGNCLDHDNSSDRSVAGFSFERLYKPVLPEASDYVCH